MNPVLAFIGPIGWPELLVILVLVLIVFGPRRLPEIADAIGKSINKFRAASREATTEVRRELDDVKKDVGNSPEKEPEKRREEEPRDRT